MFNNVGIFSLCVVLLLKVAVAATDHISVVLKGMSSEEENSYVSILISLETDTQHPK